MPSHLCRNAVFASLSAFIAALSACPASAQVMDTFTGTSSSYVTAANWSTMTVPGSFDDAIFDTNSSATTIVINFGVSGVQQVGEISLLANNAHTRTFVDSSSSNPGILQLNGYTVNGITTLISNASSSLLTFSPAGTGTPAQILKVNLAATGNIDVSGSGGITFTSVIMGTNGLTKTGVGTGLLTLSAANTFTGVTTVAGGTLKLDFSAATAPTSNIIDSNSGLVLGGSFTMTGNSTALSTQTVTGVTLQSGYLNSTAGTVTVTAGASANATLNLGNITRTGSSLLGNTAINFVATNGTSGIANITTTAANTNGLLAGNLTYGGSAFATNSGGNVAAYTGATALTTASISSATGATNFDEAIGGTVTLGTGTSNANSIRFTGTGTGTSASTTTLTIGTGKTLLVTSGGILDTIVSPNTTYGNGVTISGGTLTSGDSYSTNRGDLSIYQNSPNSNSGVSISSVITDNGATSIGLNVSGGGYVTLTGANSYTGGTTLSGSASVLSISGTGTFGAATNLLTVNGGILRFQNESGTIGGLSGGSGGSIINTNSGGTTAAVITDNQNFDTTYAGTIGDGSSGSSTTIGLTKNGTGNLTLSGANTYSGGTIINGGTVTMNGTLVPRYTLVNSTISSTIAINNGGTLAGTGTASNAIILNSGGTLSPGVGGIGTLSSASFTWNSGGIAGFDLSSTNGTSDVLALTGAFTGGGTGSTTYQFNFNGGMTGQTYTLATFGSSSNVTQSQFAASGATGTFALNSGSLQFLITGTASTPEPNAAALLGMGIISVCGVAIPARRLSSRVKQRLAA